MKKRIIILILLVSVLTSCNLRKMDINSVLGEPNFKGVVVEISNEWVYVKVLQPDEEQVTRKEEVYKLPKEPQLKDTIMKFDIGQTLQIYFDSSAIDNDKMVIETVYAYNLLEPL